MSYTEEPDSPVSPSELLGDASEADVRAATERLRGRLEVSGRIEAGSVASKRSVARSAKSGSGAELARVSSAGASVGLSTVSTQNGEERTARSARVSRAR